ncbi:hypothetical protein YTPLAS18_13050 [Nitrospira sp.]|nr:hypothetical protein YTPLAS18_13050 [Nitrospira sp.]
MTETKTAPKGLFIQSDLRPDVHAEVESTALPGGTGASTAEIASVASHVLTGAGYPSACQRWDPSLFLGRVLTHSCDVQFTVLDDEAVLLNLTNGHYYTLNRVGTMIWGSLDGRRPLNDTLDQLCKQFEVDRGRAHDDLVALVVRMEHEGLLQEERR